MEETKCDLKVDYNTLVNCSTEELAKEVLSIIERLGYKWNDGTLYSHENAWERWRINTCYDIHNGFIGHIGYYECIGCNIISAKEFISLHKK